MIIYASGIKIVIHNPPGSPMPAPGRLAFCGGVALYLVGVSAFRLRMLGELSRGRLGVAGALVVLFALLKSAPAWTVRAGFGEPAPTGRGPGQRPGPRPGVRSG